MEQIEHNETQRTIVVGVELPFEEDFAYSIEELINLTGALDLITVGQLMQKLKTPNHATYIGAGKAEELRAMCEELEVNLVVFNDELSPSQIRNLEKHLEVTVYDRTMLILDIFGERAKTKEAQLQVEIARLQYLLPRLVGMRASLSRQGGSGAGLANRGAGETKLELDRRKIETRISALSKELNHLSDRRSVQRKQRKKQALPVVALVGYTNAGKSTLMNAMLDQFEPNARKHVREEDRLFATLDTSVRRVETKDNKAFLLADTVGFVSKLPHHLVKAFRSTLEEAREADLLIHVVDYSNEHHGEMMKITDKTLKSIGVVDVPMVYAYNKIDATDEKGVRAQGNELFLSAKERRGLELFEQALGEHVFHDYVQREFFIPYTEGHMMAYLNEVAHVRSMAYEEEGTRLFADVRERDAKKYAKFQV
ncbi:GTPase HflX [Shouchella shacheensis]|uniref:GTPase HflX n=1 Tax=Shouchella shacheensis TaxID=1649580 RepID=UPI00073FCC42|nr:GTPase HflX [Shouchella shacheensis]